MDSTREPDELGRQIRKARRQVRRLRSRASDLPPSEQYQLLADSFDEIQQALEELQAAHEVLRQRTNELSAMRERAEAERHRYQELFECAPDGYLVTDVDGVIREANRAAARSLNATQQALIGQPLMLFLEDDRQRVFGTSMIGLRDTEVGEEWMVRIRPLGGPSFKAALTVSVVRDRAGRPLALRWLLRNIDQRVSGARRSDASQRREAKRER